jgi:hypothetical protein
MIIGDNSFGNACEATYLEQDQTILAETFQEGQSRRPDERVAGFTGQAQGSVSDPLPASPTDGREKGLLSRKRPERRPFFRDNPISGWFYSEE